MYVRGESRLMDHDPPTFSSERPARERAVTGAYHLAAALVVALCVILWGCSDEESGDGQMSVSEPEPISTTLPPGYARYENERFRYSIAYPESLFSAEGDMADGVGRSFASPDSSVRMSVFATERAAADTLGSVADEAVQSVFQGRLDSLRERTGLILYSTRGDSSFVISGTYDDLIYYEKTLLYDRYLARFEIEYPIARKSEMDSVLTVVSHSFGGRIWNLPD